MTFFFCLFVDRVNEYSDEDEEGEFSSNEDNDDGLTGYDAKRGYAKRGMGNYRKMGRTETEGEADDLPNNPVDSDSEFENIPKDKGSRAKMSRVSFFFF